MYFIQNKFRGIIFVGLMLVTSQLFSQEIFIAINGNDNGDGSINAPYETIEKALKAVAKLTEKDGKTSFTIYLREGTYTIDKTIHLEKNVSNITLRAYANEKVVFSGGISIPISKIQKRELPKTEFQVQRSVYKVDLKSIGITNYGKIRNVGFARPFGSSWGEVFVNGKALHLSRWPNDGMIHTGKVLDEGSIPRNDDFSKRGGVFEYESDRISSWKKTSDIWISGYFKWGYADDAVQIAKIDKKNKTITTAQPTLYGFASGEHFRRWYAFNVFEELDEDGEFYIDREKGILYFMSSEKEIEFLEFSMLEKPFFQIENAANIKIEGINFEYSRGLGIAMCNTENVRIENCTFSNLGSLGVTIGKGIEPFTDYRHAGDGISKAGIVGNLQQHLYANTTFNRDGGVNNTIINCEFYQLGAGGVSLGGGNRETLTPGNNTIENCVFHDLNRIEKSYRPAVHLTGVGNKIIHSEIYNTPSMAVLMHGNNHLLEYNYIHDVVLDADDQGAFYYGRDPSERETVVRYNYFENIPDTFRTCAIYNDDGACGLIVDSNVFYKAGYWNVLLGGGSDNVYTNNIFIGTKHGIHVDNRMQNWSKGLLDKGGLIEKRLNVVNFQKPPYSTQYPVLVDYWSNAELPTGNLVENNVFYQVEKLFDGKKEWLDYKDANLKTDEDLQFTDFENRDFSLKSKSEVFKKLPNFKEIPFHKIGLYKTENVYEN